MRITLRNWQKEDISRLVALANNPKIAANMTDGFPHPYNEENARGFINFAINGSSYVMAILSEGEIVGGIGLHPQTDISRMNVELGYWIGEPYWNKGIATEAIKQMTNWGFENLPIHRIFARPFGYNIGSQKALEKAGYALEARIKDGFYKNGQFVDELIYSKTKIQ